jgi:uncharacterized metal-binding protein YceD (DUF177 family)
MSRRPEGAAWSHRVRLEEIGRLSQPIALTPDEAARARIARALDLVEVRRLEGEVRLAPWLDGVEADGRWSASVVYRCGLTLEPFDAELSGRFTVRAVPPDSPQAVEAASDLELELEAEDPPDVLDGDSIDVAELLVEHLALELDPFPRKPGAVFEPPAPEEPESPFAVLRRLRPASDDDQG